MVKLASGKHTTWNNEVISSIKKISTETSESPEKLLSKMEKNLSVAYERELWGSEIVAVQINQRSGDLSLQMKTAGQLQSYVNPHTGQRTGTGPWLPMAGKTFWEWLFGGEESTGKNAYGSYTQESYSDGSYERTYENGTTEVYDADSSKTVWTYRTGAQKIVLKDGRYYFKDSNGKFTEGYTAGGVKLPKSSFIGFH